MGSTRINAYPYPEDVDAATVPSFMRAAMELMAQGDVMRFGNAAERTAVFATLGTSPAAGMFSYLADLDRYYRYTGSAWVPFGHPPSAAVVSTAQGTASVAYTNLATPGPAVTVDTGTNAMVYLTAGIYNSGANVSYMGFVVSGASAIAAADANSAQNANTTGIRVSVAVLVTGLTPGQNIFTAQYKAGAGTANFFDRTITVQSV